MGSHCVTFHLTHCMHPALTPARQASTRFTYPRRMEGWVDLGVVYIPRWFTCLQTITHPSSNQLIVAKPGVEPTSSWSQVQHPNHYATKPPWLHWLQSITFLRQIQLCIHCKHTTAVWWGVKYSTTEQNILTQFFWRKSISWKIYSEQSIYSNIC